MSFKLRAITDVEYDEVLVNWWKDWRWTPPSKDFLPNIGIMVSKEDIDICAGYLYVTNSKVSWIEFIVSNFNYRESDRKEAIEFLINSMCVYAKNAGTKYIYTSLNNRSLIKRYENCGFQTGSEGCVELIKIL